MSNVSEEVSPLNLSHHSTHHVLLSSPDNLGEHKESSENTAGWREKKRVSANISRNGLDVSQNSDAICLIPSKNACFIMKMLYL